jgi:hypothetical protein
MFETSEEVHRAQDLNEKAGGVRGESATAFHAYVVYRDLGPDRTLQAAWEMHLAEPIPEGTKARGRPRKVGVHTRCSRQWTGWSAELNWRERAAAFDAGIDAEKRAARKTLAETIENQRFALEVRKQDLRERSVKRLDALHKRLTDAAAGVSGTGVTQRITETSRRKRILTLTTTVPALNLRGCARLVNQRNLAALRAIVGDGRRRAPSKTASEDHSSLRRSARVQPVKHLVGESGAAARAFRIYRDLGANRSLNLAWRRHLARWGVCSERVRCPGRWQAWSRKWKWVERAAEYDAARSALRLEHDAQLEERRRMFEYEDHPRILEMINRNEAMLDKADEGPITDVVVKKKEIDAKVIRTTTDKIKGVDLGGYGALTKATNESAWQGVPKPRDAWKPTRVVREQTAASAKVAAVQMAGSPESAVEQADGVERTASR